MGIPEKLSCRQAGCMLIGQFILGQSQEEKHVPTKSISHSVDSIVMVQCRYCIMNETVLDVGLHCAKLLSSISPDKYMTTSLSTHASSNEYLGDQ